MVGKQTKVKTPTRFAQLRIMDKLGPIFDQAVSILSDMVVSCCGMYCIYSFLIYCNTTYGFLVMMLSDTSNCVK
jgi:hypothetical protein